MVQRMLLDTRSPSFHLFILFRPRFISHLSHFFRLFGAMYTNVYNFNLNGTEDVLPPIVRCGKMVA